MHVETDVDHRYAVRQVTDGDDVDTGFGYRDDGVLVDATGGLSHCPAVHNFHGFGHFVEVHVVEHDDLNAGVECFSYLIEGLAFNLDVERVLRAGAQYLHGLGNTTREFDVVVFNEDAVAEIEDMVVRAADPHGVFLHHAQTGPTLACIGHADVGVP